MKTPYCLLSKKMSPMMQCQSTYTRELSTKFEGIIGEELKHPGTTKIVTQILGFDFKIQYKPKGC